MARKHYSKLPPIQGFTRIPDRPCSDGSFSRMVRCDFDGTEIPSLGVGYHIQSSKAHKEAVRARRAAHEPIRPSEGSHS
jgi:hypothetical protein